MVTRHKRKVHMEEDYITILLFITPRKKTHIVLTNGVSKLETNNVYARKMVKSVICLEVIQERRCIIKQLLKAFAAACH